MRKSSFITSAVLVAVSLLAFSTQASAALPLGEFHPGYGVSKRWVGAAVSDNGMIGYAALDSASGYDDQPSMTTDGGVVFLQMQYAPRGRYLAVDTTADGSKAFFVMTDGSSYQVQMSTNAGDSWGQVVYSATEITDIAVSGDGQVILVAYESQDPQITVDGGLNWNIAASTGGGIRFAEVSADGSTIAGTQNGDVLISSDHGLSWSRTSVASSSVTSGVNLSKDGSRVFVSTMQGTDSDAYVSNDGGSTFTASGLTYDPYGAQGTYSAMSNDGSMLLWGFYGGHLNMSRDGGETWEMLDQTGGWLSFAIGARATRAFALQESGSYFYFALDPVISSVQPSDLYVNTRGVVTVKGENLIESCRVRLTSGGEFVDITPDFINSHTLKFDFLSTLEKSYDVQLFCDQYESLVSNIVSDGLSLITAPAILPPTGSRASGSLAFAMFAMLLGASLVVWRSRTRRA